MKFEFLTGMWHQGKLMFIIIYEDLSYVILYKKNKTDYRFNHKGKSYFIIPERIIRGKNSMLVYYYNNPMPLEFKYQYSKLKALDNYEDDEIAKLTPDQKLTLDNITIDSRALKILSDANVIKGMFGVNDFWEKWKWVIIIGGVIFIVVMVAVIGQQAGWWDLSSLFKDGVKK